jgi:cyclopropane fatty-acyl-phospholipid synthase-like methyltransferase
MTRRLDEEIARALDAPVSLLPHLGFLYRDLPDLSGATADGVSMLASCGLADGGAVLDLGCGRGEIAMAVAKRFSASVDGVDALEDFVDAARRKAEADGLSGRCRFESGDLRDWLEGSGHYDAVLMIALGPVLGKPEATVARLRNEVAPGGLILVDDAFLADGAKAPPGYEDYLDRTSLRRALTRHGDEIVGWRESAETARAYNRAALAAIERRAAELARRRPQLKDHLAELLAIQKRETEFMEGPVVPVLWCVRRTGNE